MGGRVGRLEPVMIDPFVASAAMTVVSWKSVTYVLTLENSV